MDLDFYEHDDYEKPKMEVTHGTMMYVSCTEKIRRDRQMSGAASISQLEGRVGITCPNEAMICSITHRWLGVPLQKSDGSDR